MMVEIRFSRSKSLFSGLLRASNVSQSALYTRSRTQLRRHRERAGSVDAAVIGHQHAVNRPELLTRHEHRANRAADDCGNERVDPLSFTCAAVALARHDDDIAGDGLPRYNLPWDSRLDAGAAGYSSAGALPGELIEALPRGGGQFGQQRLALLDRWRDYR